MTSPQTREEWFQYISALSGKKLMSVARASNSMSFLNALQDEGVPPEEITEVWHMFCERLEEDGQMVPSHIPGQYLSFPDLMNSFDSQG